MRNVAKNIVIQNGSDPVQYLSGVTRIRTELQEGGYCDWMPEDEVNLTPGGSESDSGGSNGNLIEKTITRNGEYDAALDDGADGYSKVNVELPLGTKTISSNGTFRASDDAFAGYSAVTVNVGTDYLGDTTEVAAYIERNMPIVSNSYVSKVAPYAFYSNSTITSVNFPNATEIGEWAFGGCSAIRIIRCSGVKKINKNSFNKCTMLSIITLHENINIIGEGAFTYCSQLTSISLNNVTSLNANAFANCKKIDHIDLPKISSIMNGTFYNCTSLSSLSIPLVTSIGSYAFGGCTALVSVYLLSSSVAYLYNAGAFYNTPISISTITGSYGSIYVLESMVDIYKSATYWSAYSDRITAYVE